MVNINTHTTKAIKMIDKKQLTPYLIFHLSVKYRATGCIIHDTKIAIYNGVKATNTLIIALITPIL